MQPKILLSRADWRMDCCVARLGPRTAFERGALLRTLYQFAIDSGEENSYNVATPQGVMLR
jgi:hypothetical protein